jgi:hypothetical protein
MCRECALFIIFSIAFQLIFCYEMIKFYNNYKRNKYSKIEIDDNIWSLGMVGLISFSFSISCLIFVLMWNG